jgi:hypothetical protein
MSVIRTEVSRVINARPEAVYAVLSDYRVGHPAILPKPYFTGLTVEQGGKGAGTIAKAEMNVFGVKQVYRLVVTEPEPGRVMVETDDTVGIVTTFTVDSVGDGSQSKVTISTDAKTSAGFRGFMERLMNPPITRKIYNEELDLLASYVEGKQ